VEQPPATTHPDLVVHRRTLRVVSVAMRLGAIIACLAALIPLALPSADLTARGLLSSGVALIAVPFWLLASWIRRRALPDVERASALLYAAQPRSMRLQPLRVSDISGAYYALWPSEKPEGAPAWGIAALASDRKENILNERATQAEMYLDAQEAFVALRDSPRLLWGRMVDFDAARRAWRRQRLWLWANG